jgi:hypothetical protein
VSAKALNQPTFRDTDFDGDEIELDDLWQVGKEGSRSVV